MSHKNALFPGCGEFVENSLPQDRRDELVSSCMKLCYKLAQSFRLPDGRDMPHHVVEDMEQVALLACVEASRYWDPTEFGSLDDWNAKFSTYASNYIRKRLLGLVSDAKTACSLSRPDSMDIFPINESDDDGELIPLEPGEADLDLLAKLTPDVRNLVRMVIFERTSPEQAASRLNVPIKDVKLMLRTAAKSLGRHKRIADRPGLFALAEK